MFLKPLWATTQAIATAAGGIAGYLFGGIDGLVIALVAFVVADYLTGVMTAISEKKLSSAIGFKGIFRKIIIFTLVGLANLLDVHVLGDTGVLRTATIFFYISNEGISLLENATRLGLPVPERIREALDLIGHKHQPTKPNPEGENQ
ncbi:MAG: phage holin family protein [Arcanobacterium sp.]|nr:phage holin family protein [Arcanobacterium sp.]